MHRLFLNAWQYLLHLLTDHRHQLPILLQIEFVFLRELVNDFPVVLPLEYLDPGGHPVRAKVHIKHKQGHLLCCQWHIRLLLLTGGDGRAQHQWLVLDFKAWIKVEDGAQLGSGLLHLHICLWVEGQLCIVPLHFDVILGPFLDVLGELRMV